jgi:hypothetical protein
MTNYGRMLDSQTQTAGETARRNKMKTRLAIIAYLFLVIGLFATAAKAQDRECTTTPDRISGGSTTVCKDKKPAPETILQALDRHLAEQKAARKAAVEAAAAKKAAVETAVEVEAAIAKKAADEAEAATAKKAADAQAAAAQQAASKADSTLAANERVWTSMTSANDFKVRIDGDYIYIQRINLPPDLQSHGAFMRAELKKTGDKWVGKYVFNYPPWGSCNPMQADYEIDMLSENRIEGKSLVLKSINPKKCWPETTEMKPFTWIPK